MSACDKTLCKYLQAKGEWDEKYCLICRNRNKVCNQKPKEDKDE